jgi:hypothetical protein
MTTRTLPAPPADDLFSDDFITAQDIAVRDARRNSGRKVVRVEVAQPVEIEPVACGRCGRKLTSATSRERGTGPTCDRKLRAAMTAIGETFSARQIAAAVELITDGGVVVGPSKACIAVSSDGSTTYAVDPTGGTCACKAGQHGRACYHLAAALALTA